MAIITVVVLYLSILLNVLFKNAFANVLVGFSLFLVTKFIIGLGSKFPHSFIH